MVLEYPVWLVLAIPLAIAVQVWRLPSRLLQALRLIVIALIVVAMSSPAVKLPSREGTIVVVADRSLSMPPGSDEIMAETINLIHNGMAGEDRLAVVSFGDSAVIERAPERGRFPGFTTQIMQDGSDLAEALDLAVALLPPKAPGRILVLSDGRWTTTDPASTASRAAARGIGIDYRLLERSTAGDVAIVRLDVPNSVSPGESFTMTAWIYSPVPQSITYRLEHGTTALAAGTRDVPSGLSRLVFRDTAAESGTNAYRFSVAGNGDDPMPENNVAKILVGVSGPRPVLCVSGSPDSGLPKLLQDGGLDMKHGDLATQVWTLEELSNYSAVMLENVPAQAIGERGMETLAAWVKETGSGLMLTGGMNAYGPGGYYQSPLEAIMPVTMELRLEHRGLPLAIVVALDRSGSMMAPVGGGRTKMDLANRGTAEALRMLGPSDEFGCIAVDSAPHVICRFGPVADKAAIQSRILKIASMGGGIFIFEALKAASEMILKAKAETRHIILFADAADSEEPGLYVDLIRALREARTTVSVIGLGTEHDCDAGLLKDIAQRGGGRCYFTQDATTLPRLFAQDTIVVARSAFVGKSTPVRITAGLKTLTGRSFETMPGVGGYNLCYLRPRANLAVATTDRYKAPLVASWHAGIGRVLCYTGEADGKYTGEMARWPIVGDFYSSMVRWTAGDPHALPGNMLLTQRLRRGVCVIELHLDPEREAEPLTELPVVRTLRGKPGESPAADETVTMQWTTADTLAVEVPLHGGETSLSSVDVPGAGPVAMAPICLPYSPEFQPQEIAVGRITLDRLARATGGQERIDLAGIWAELPKAMRYVEIAHWLIGLALIVLLVEVLERRTGILSMGPAVLWRRRRTEPEPEPDHAPARLPHIRRRRSRRVSVTAEKPAPAAPQAAPAAEKKPLAPSPKEKQPGMADALRRASRRARDRTRR
ncbi:MAG: VWA domain-containing protein [Verrucomicrobia bacterium]|nr:VWA domain-containing protein [Verrucomicrobiota bacterium]